MSSPSRSTPPDPPPPTGCPLTMQFSAHASFYSSDHKAPKSNFSSLRANAKIRISESPLPSQKCCQVREDCQDNVGKGDILYNLSCIMDSQRFDQPAGFRDISATCIHVFSPVVECWSSLAYSIASCIHSDVARHEGYETCFRQSHSHARIIIQTYPELERDKPLIKSIIDSE